MILRDPIQLTNCGHRTCQSCLPENILTVQCSQCQIETSPNNIKIDRAFLNGMQSIPIDCCYCEWNNIFGNYQVHIDQYHSNTLQHVSYDGTYVWKITNVQEKISQFVFVFHVYMSLYLYLGDAQSERQISIYSPPFYSSSTGYKMCMRLYLNGNGNARRTHMSLFFVLMRGSYDAILKFPFNYKVTFCLYDQTPHQRHIIDSFRPDTKSNSFQRPRSEMNIASGIPEFVPLAMIQQEGNPYVRDDTMFIRAMVDFNNMENALLRYALNLDPGLPNHVKQVPIQRELERRV